MLAVLQRWLRCPSCALAAFGALFAIAIVALFLSDLQDRHRHAIDDAKQSARSLAEVLAEHCARTFEAVDRTLHEAEEIRWKALSGEYSSRDSVNAELIHLKQSSPVIVAIGWTGPDGELENYSHEEPPALPNLARAQHFVALHDNPNADTFIGPLHAATTDAWTTVVARRLSDARGGFAGIVAALVDPSYFAGLYRSIMLGDGATVVLLHRDGRIVAREPPLERALASNFSNSPLLTRYLPKADVGTYESISSVDGSRRISGYKAVPGRPLIVRVSYNEATVLRPWHTYLRWAAPLIASLVAVILLGTYFLVRQQRSLARKTNLLELTLQNMSHGLAMYDREQKLVLSNQRYGDMYGLATEDIKPGTSLRSILEIRASRNTHSDDDASFIAARLEEVRRPDARHAINQLHDGRMISVTRQPLEDGGWIALHQDITAQRKIEAEIARMARNDALTDLANRAMFMEKIGEASEGLRARGDRFSILLLDLDQFKDVNDSLGHPVGDALLKQVAARLRSVAREADTVARLGGDEFAILQPADADQKDSAIVFANRIVQALTEPYAIDGYKVMIGTSIGIAMAPDNGVAAEELLRNADLALYRTKAQGRNGYRFFEAWMEEEARSRRARESDLRNAVARGEFELYYQSITDIRSQEVCAVEALVRWHHPQRGLVGPDQFISLAEETELIIPLGEWILRRACADAASWPAHVKLAINLSPVQFGRGDLLETVTRALADAKLPPERLELEVTESILLRNNGDNVAILNELKSLGVSIVLDDFGTGYSSLSYLQMFQFEKLKIDKSFVADLANRAECAAIVCAVIGLARSLGMGTTAEGVETREQFELLRAAGCREAQGYLLSRPAPVSALTFTTPDAVRRIG